MTEHDPVAGSSEDEKAAERRLNDEARRLVRELLIERPLYAKINGEAALMEAVDRLIKAEVELEFDLYCMTCDQVTPWAIKPYRVANTGGGAGMRYASQVYVPSVRAVNAVCLRKQHFYTYVIFRQGSFAQKIGQKPSLADIAHGELRAIKVSDSRDRKELGRALGLFAHDTPLGAFVYLRRVFERMVDRSHEYHRSRTGAPIENWLNLRMGERIRALGDALPSQVSANAGVFGLLSKGIHELSDEDADTLFPLVKAVIFQMLGDEERHRQDILARDETNKALQAAIARYSPAAELASGIDAAAADEGGADR